MMNFSPPSSWETPASPSPSSISSSTQGFGWNRCAAAEGGQDVSSDDGRSSGFKSWNVLILWDTFHVPSFLFFCVHVSSLPTESRSCSSKTSPAARPCSSASSSSPAAWASTGFATPCAPWASRGCRRSRTSSTPTWTSLKSSDWWVVWSYDSGVSYAYRKCQRISDFPRIILCFIASCCKVNAGPSIHLYFDVLLGSGHWHLLEKPFLFPCSSLFPPRDPSFVGKLTSLFLSQQ